MADVMRVLEAAGATEIRVSQDEAQRLLLWSGRKAAFPAVGRISPDYYCIDGTIPRAALPRVLKHIEAWSREFGLACANVFHAGDGNLHPLILFDANKPGESERTVEFGDRILELCIEVGGTITGEHGVGVEKMRGMCTQFAAPELERFLAIKRAFDAARPAQPRQGRAHAGPLRRIRPDARPPRRAAAPGAAALLRVAAIASTAAPRRRDRVVAAPLRGAACRGESS